MAASRQTCICILQCSPASVGLAQALPIGYTLMPQDSQISYLLEPSHECLQLKNLRWEKAKSR